MDVLQRWAAVSVAEKVLGNVVRVGEVALARAFIDALESGQIVDHDGVRTFEDGGTNRGWMIVMTIGIVVRIGRVGDEMPLLVRTIDRSACCL